MDPFSSPLAGAGGCQAAQWTSKSDQPTSPFRVHFRRCCQVRPQACYLASFQVLSSDRPPQEGILTALFSLGRRDS